MLQFLFWFSWLGLSVAKIREPAVQGARYFGLYQKPKNYTTPCAVMIADALPEASMPQTIVPVALRARPLSFGQGAAGHTKRSRHDPRRPRPKVDKPRSPLPSEGANSREACIVAALGIFSLSNSAKIQLRKLDMPQLDQPST